MQAPAIAESLQSMRSYYNSGATKYAIGKQPCTL